jgi:hypothetical protein
MLKICEVREERAASSSVSGSSSASNSASIACFLTARKPGSFAKPEIVSLQKIYES